MRFYSQVSLIAAMDETGGIGKDGQIPWHISADLKHFRKVTDGHPVIMGRKTFESIGRPLPNRENIIITRNPDYRAEGAVIVSTLTDGIAWAEQSCDSEIFVIGGGQIYQEAMPLADRLYLTKIKGTYGCDTFFPSISEFSRIVSRRSMTEGDFAFEFLELERG